MKITNLIGQSVIVSATLVLSSVVTLADPGSVWPPHEQVTRNLLLRFGAELKRGLRDLEQGAVIGGVRQDGRDYPGYTTAAELYQSLKARETYTALWKTGKVLLADKEYSGHTDADPLIIYVTDDSEDFFRVVYMGQSGVRIVRAGTREYERILSKARSRGYEGGSRIAEHSTASLRPVAILFTDESGHPLSGTFALHERNGREFLSAWFYDLPVPSTGRLDFEDFPVSFTIFFTSHDGYYTTQKTDLDFTMGSKTHTISINPAGVLAFSISDYLKDKPEPIVARCLRKDERGYTLARGIGIFPEIAREFCFDGLPPGLYKVELKRHHEDAVAICESPEIEVRAKEKAVLKPFVVKRLPKSNGESQPRPAADR